MCYVILCIPDPSPNFPEHMDDALHLFCLEMNLKILKSENLTIYMTFSRLHTYLYISITWSAFELEESCLGHNGREFHEKFIERLEFG